MTIEFPGAVVARFEQSLCKGCVAALVALALAGCGNKSAEGPSQVVASVGGEEVTESQVNHILERQANLKPDQLEATSRKVVSGLVEQEIVLQKARELKLDRDQVVVQNVEAMKREIMTKAYLDRIADGVAKPTPKEIAAYFDENPALFKQRRIYTFQEVAVEASEAQKKTLEAQLTSLKSPAELDAYLKTNGMSSRSSRSTITAENVPLPLLQRISELKPGQGLVLPANAGMRILLLLSAQDSPVAEEQARPAIGVFLLNQRKRLAIEKELAALRSATKVAYFGKYADLAASAAPSSGAASAAAGVAVAARVSPASAPDASAADPK